MKSSADAILGIEQAAYLEGIEPARDALLAEMERFARDRHQPISDPEVASFLAVTTRACKPTRIVEVGTNIGYGAIVLARDDDGDDGDREHAHARDRGLPEPARRRRHRDRTARPLRAAARCVAQRRHERARRRVARPRNPPPASTLP
jgi:hypothetical protein